MHNLNVTNGKVSAAYATGKKGVPWHQLGQMVKDAMNWPQAMQLAQLDWEVEKRQGFFANPEFKNDPTQPKGFKAPGHFYVCRNDVVGENSVLGTVGATYEPTQNIEIGGWIDQVMESIDGAHYEAAGALGKGERVWALARVPFNASIGKDEHQTFLLFMSAHDGSMSNTIMLTDVRVVCQNTLTYALNKGTKDAMIRVRHTIGAKDRLKNMTRNIQTGLKQDVTGLKEKFEKILNWKATPEGINNIFNKTFGEGWLEKKSMINKVSKVAELFNLNDNNAIPEQKGTGMAILNAMTNFVDHERPSRITASSGYSTAEQARADSALVGGGATLKRDALTYILEEVDCTPTPTNANPSVQVNTDQKDTLNNIAEMMDLAI